LLVVVVVVVEVALTSLGLAAGPLLLVEGFLGSRA